MRKIDWDQVKEDLEKSKKVWKTFTEPLVDYWSGLKELFRVLKDVSRNNLGGIAYIFSLVPVSIFLAKYFPNKETGTLFFAFILWIDLMLVSWIGYEIFSRYTKKED